MADPEIVEDSKSKGKKQPEKEAAAPAGDGKEKAAAKKGLPVNPMIIIGVFSVILAIGAAFFMVQMLTPHKPVAAKTETAEAGAEPKEAGKEAGAEAGKEKKEGEKKHGEKKKGHGKEGEAPESPYFTFEKPFVVNLADTNGERYLKVDMSFQMSTPDLSEELKTKKVQVMDLLITILSRKNLEAVSTTVGKNMLKEEIMEKINAQLETGSVTNIYFTEFVVQ
jgi:flagellar basal body-associated protein FliL